MLADAKWDEGGEEDQEYEKMELEAIAKGVLGWRVAS